MARTSTTSLLRSYQSRQKSIRDWEDQVKDFEWQYGAKSDAEYLAYINYYEGRRQYAEDNSDLLAIESKQKQAFRAYKSNKITEASIDIIEGRQPAEYKLRVLEGLYTDAVANEDFDLAQSLRLQIDNEIVKMQEDALGGGSGGGGGSSSSSIAKEQYNALRDYQDEIKNGKAINSPYEYENKNGEIMPLTIDGINQLISEYGLDAANAKIQEGLSKAGAGEYSGLDPLELATNIMYSQVDAAEQFASTINDIDYGGRANNLVAELKSTNYVMLAGQKFTLQDLIDTADYNRLSAINDLGGESRYKTVYKNGKYEIQEQTTVAHSFAYDPMTGDITLTPVYGANDVYAAKAGDMDNSGDYLRLIDGTIIRMSDKQASLVKSMADNGRIDQEQLMEAFGRVKPGSSEAAARGEQDGYMISQAIKDTLTQQSASEINASQLNTDSIYTLAGLQKDQTGGGFTVTDQRIKNLLNSYGIYDETLSPDQVDINEFGDVVVNDPVGNRQIAIKYDPVRKINDVVENVAQTPDEYLGVKPGEKYRSTATSLLGRQRKNESLQSNINAGVLTKGQSGAFLNNSMGGPFGTTSNLLQQNKVLNQYFDAKQQADIAKRQAEMLRRAQQQKLKVNDKPAYTGKLQVHNQSNTIIQPNLQGQYSGKLYVKPTQKKTVSVSTKPGGQGGLPTYSGTLKVSNAGYQNYGLRVR